MFYAVKYGHLEIVKFFHAESSQEYNVNFMDRAASGGHLEIVKFFHENRQEIRVRVIHWG
jgi:hypothetical protein